MGSSDSANKPDSSSTPATGQTVSSTATAEPKSAVDAGGGSTPQLPAEDLVADLEAAKKEAADNHERYLRAMADLDNFRRRTVRDKEDLRLFAASRVLEDLLPVLDNLALGLAAAKQPNADLKTLVGGVEMVQQQLKTALSNHGLKEINPVGQPFDANLHESIAAQPSNDVPEGNVVSVVRIGYTLNGRLLRPASVVLSSGSAKQTKS